MVTEANQPRNRLLYVALVLLTIFLGLASRKFSVLLPEWLAKNAGDVLYATMVFWLAGVLVPRLSTARTAIAALLFCVGIEFLKFDNAAWMVAMRASSAGALVFGRGFHLSNLVCYTLGTALAIGIETKLTLRSRGGPVRRETR